MISIPLAAAIGLILGMWLMHWFALVVASALLVGGCVALDVPPLEMVTAWAMLQVFYLIGGAVGCRRA